MTLQGRVALVTGGGRGIGRGISLALAKDGATVAVNYRRDAESAEKTVAEIREAGGTADAYLAPVDDYDALAVMVEQIASDHGPVDILVHNGGIASRGQSVADTDPAELERVVRVHALGPHVLTKLVLPGMRTRPRGDIVMISSVATQRTSANGAPYAMGKAAMEALALTLAKEERPNGIRVNVVGPGLVDTDMGRRLVKATAGIEDIHTLDPMQPFGRVGAPQDIADMVRFLVSDRAAYITGQIVYVDGGTGRD